MEWIVYIIIIVLFFLFISSGNEQQRKKKEKMKKRAREKRRSQYGNSSQKYDSDFGQEPGDEVAYHYINVVGERFESNRTGKSRQSIIADM